MNQLIHGVGEMAFITDDERIPRGFRDVQSSHGYLSGQRETRGRLERARNTSPRIREKSGSKGRIFWVIEEKPVASGHWSSLAGT